MSRYEHEVGEMLEYVTQYSTAFNVVVKDKENNDITLADTKSVCDFMDTLYWDRIFLSKYENIQDAESNFEKVFKSFMKRHEVDFSLMYQALYDYKYSPIENYNRIEESDVVKGGKDTNNTTETSENTITYGTIDTREDNLSATAQSNATDRNAGTDIISKAVSGFNQPNTMNDSERETTTYGKETSTTGNTTTTNTGTQKNTKSGTDSNNSGSVKSSEMSYGGTEKTTSNIHGNIGVTTNQQMIESEIEMRKSNLLENIIEQFINFTTVFM